MTRSYWGRDSGGARFAIRALAVAGALLCTGQVLLWLSMGAWPLHDSAAFWLAGAHFREGMNPYAGDVNYLTMLYAPPWVLLMAVISVLPFEVLEFGLLAGQVLALRYIGGSWLAAGLLCWLPFVPRELATGNVDLVMAAAVLAAVRGGPSWPIPLFAFAKWSPAFALAAPLSRRREAIVAGALMLAATLPWLWLWPAWWTELQRAQDTVSVLVPLLPRLPIALGLAALRRPWAAALAVFVGVPGLYIQSLVLVLPAARLAVEWLRSDGFPAWRDRTRGVAPLP
jgi:hypothetical protein